MLKQLVRRIYRKATKLIEKHAIIALIFLGIPCAFLFGFVAISGIPIPVIYDFANGGVTPTPIQTIEVHAIDTTAIGNLTPPMIAVSSEGERVVVRGSKYIDDDFGLFVNETTIVSNPNAPTLNLGEWYSWQRDNVSGYKPLSAHFSAYRTVGLKNYTWHSYDWGADYNQEAGDGYEYLFVFCNLYLDTNSDRMWIPDWRHFAIQYDNTVIYPDTKDFDPVDYIVDFINLNYKNLNDDSLVKPYDYTIYYRPAFKADACEVYDSGNTAFYYNCNYPTHGGYIANITGWVYPGRSNAEDGWILFKVPSDWRDHDVKLITDMYTFGSPTWKITGNTAVLTAERLKRADTLTGTAVPTATPTDKINIRGYYGTNSED